MSKHRQIILPNPGGLRPADVQVDLRRHNHWDGYQLVLRPKDGRRPLSVDLSPDMLWAIGRFINAERFARRLPVVS